MSIKFQKANVAKGKGVDSYKLQDYRECPVCDSSSREHVWGIPDFQYFSDGENKIVDVKVSQCKTCKALFTNPVVNNFGFSVLFSECGASYGYSDGRMEEQISWMERSGVLPCNSLIDVGSYLGAFLSLLPKEIDKCGVDIDEICVDQAKKKHPGIDFICGAFEDFKTVKKYDVITMFHVLEHLSNPKDVLKNLLHISNDETKLIVEVPVLEGGLTNDINGFFSVQHMTHFSQRSLINMLELSGWNVQSMMQQDSYNGCRILATPSNNQKGLITDSTYTEDFLLRKYLHQWYKNTIDVSEKINKAIDGEQKVVIWGTGLHLEFLYHLTSLFKDSGRLLYIVDIDKNKQGKKYRGLTINSPDRLLDIYSIESPMMIISSYGSQDKIADSALDFGVPKNKMVKLYDYLRLY